MKTRYVLVLGLAVLLAFAFFVAACGSGEETTTTAAPVTTAPPTTAPASTESTATTEAPTTTSLANTAPFKLGVAISLTGDSAAPCGQIKEGMETEVKYINANGGIKGRQIELILVDDQSKMDTAAAAVQSLIDQKVDVIVGPFPAWTNFTARQLAEEAGVMLVCWGPWSLADLDAERSQDVVWQYTFQIATGPDGGADAYLKEMQADARKNVLGVGDQMTMSQDTLKYLSESLPKNGIQFTAMSDSWGLGETDITPIANKIAAKAKEIKPDAILLASNPVHVNVMTKVLRGLGVTAPIYNQASGSHPVVMLEPAGNDPGNVAGDYTFGPAIVDPSRIPDTYASKQDLVKFIARWKADYPDEPFASLFLGFPYDAIWLVKQAVESAAEDTPEAWAASMEKVDWWGAQGHYVFSEADHVGNHGGFLQWQYTDGDGFKFIRELN
jgi:branched-chain amino acid transport system substrate-binding protein